MHNLSFKRKMSKTGALAVPSKRVCSPLPCNPSTSTCSGTSARERARWEPKGLSNYVQQTGLTRGGKKLVPRDGSTRGYDNSRSSMYQRHMIHTSAITYHTLRIHADAKHACILEAVHSNRRVSSGELKTKRARALPTSL